MSNIKSAISKLSLSPNESRRLEEINGLQQGLQDTLVEWSHVNSGSHNADGLKTMRGLIKQAFSVLPGQISEVELQKGEYVQANGNVQEITYEPSLLLQVRPDADIQIVLTGHYDTVFPKDSHFQTTSMIDDDTLGGPGVADMKGGILVMLTALKALEKCENANNVGYCVLISPDEEIGSPGSAPLLAKLG